MCEMADATGRIREPLRVAFYRCTKLEFHGARIISTVCLPAYRELDDALGVAASTPTRTSMTPGCLGTGSFSRKNAPIVINIA